MRLRILPAVCIEKREGLPLSLGLWLVLIGLLASKCGLKKSWAALDGSSFSQNGRHLKKTTGGDEPRTARGETNADPQSEDGALRARLCAWQYGQILRLA